MAANARPELQGVSTSFSVTSPSYKYELDQKKIEMLGVNLADVYSALQINFGGMEVDYYNRFGCTYKVVMQSDVYFRGEVDMLKFMYVRGASGQFVPLNTLISYKLNTGTTQVTRFNGNGRGLGGWKFYGRCGCRRYDCCYFFGNIFNSRLLCSCSKYCTKNFFKR